ncbi:MAG: hypothetical protein ACI4SC_05910 [Candidatus Neoclostridium sp.]
MFGQKEKKYDFRSRLLCGFELEANCAKRKKRTDEISLKGGVFFTGFCCSETEYAKKHFCDFLRITAGVLTPENVKGINIEFIKDSRALGKYAAYKGRSVTVSDNKITVNAFDNRGAAAALYDIEKLISVAGAPYLKKGEYKNKPLFSPRMVHSAYGLDEYPEEYMVNLVKEGIDAIVVYVKDVNTTQVGKLDFNALIEKAGSIGLDVYAYCMLNNFNHPANENAEAVFDGIYGNFFRAHPGFKGLILVGESVEFPSRDEHVACRHYYELGPDNLPDGKLSPGWWPCKDYPEWLTLVVKSVRKVNPQADIVFWTYNWGFAPEKDRIALINSLPTDISLQVTFEMFEKYPAGDIDEMVCDYSIAFPGPGKYFLSEAEAAARRGIRLYTMCNAGGRTWDLGMLPFVPATELWKERYEKLVECRKKYGLTGLMECHHFGYTPSFLTRFAGYCFEESGVNADKTGSESEFENNLDLSLKEFFRGNAGIVKRALKEVSSAMRIYPPTDEMQYGPMRISTAYPLNLLKNLQPKEEQEVSNGLSICKTMFKPLDLGRYTPQCLRIDGEIKVLGKIASKIEKAYLLLEKAGNKNDGLLRLINLLKFMRCSFVTAENTLTFYKWKCRFLSADSKAKLKIAVAKLRETGAREIENAERSIEYVEKDSSLGFEPSMGYACDKERILWKIKQVKYMMETELGKYDKNL